MKWDVVSLKDIAKVKSGEGLTASQMKSEGKYAVYGGNGINGYYDEYMFETPTLILGRVGAKCGVVHITKPKSWVTDNALIVNFDEGKVDQKYLYWALVVADLNKLSSSTAQPVISGSRIYSTEIPFPPLPIQQKIAAILDEADALRRKDKVLLAKYDELLQAVFYDMFGEFLTTKGLNGIKYLSEVGDLVSGVAKNTNAIKANFVEVPYMRVANVQDGHINLKEMKTILVSQEDFDKYLLKENDLLLTEGGDPDKLGRGAVWKGEIAPCIHQNHIFRVRITDENVHPIYLSYLLSSRYGKAYFLKMAKQTTGIASINMTQLKNFKVIIPDLALQQMFARVVENIESQKSQIIKQQTHSENLFQSLMQRAFKG